MGLWGFLTGAPSAAYSPSVLVSPLASTDSLEEAIVGDFFGTLPGTIITRETAARVPELKRALTAHQSLVSPLRFEKYRGGQIVEAIEQPYWVSRCGYQGMSRLIAYKQLVEELFWEGFAVLGARLATDDTVYDWVTIPRPLWTQDRQTGVVTIDERIPVEFRQRVILVPLGARGVMSDGIDSIRQARKLELARQNRLDAPPASTELHITDANRDEMTKTEKRKLAESYVEGRQNASVAVTPSYIEVKSGGTDGELDLFEGAKNSVRLDLAMHGSVPASFVEGGREGGGGAGQMTYQNENGQPSEIWTFGSSNYAAAIAAALSGDDVVGEDAEVRADLTALFRALAPLGIDPEAGDTVGTSSGLGTSTPDTEEVAP